MNYVPHLPHAPYSRACGLAVFDVHAVGQKNPVVRGGLWNNVASRAEPGAIEGARAQLQAVVFFLSCQPIILQTRRSQRVSACIPVNNWRLGRGDSNAIASSTGSLSLLFRNDVERSSNLDRAFKGRVPLLRALRMPVEGDG